jgi:membrane protein DedA with SNARE-associated domain
MQYIEQWGALGVFIASVIPFVDAIAMVPVGIALGVNPYLAVIAAVIGDAIAIVVFAYLSSTMRNRIIKRRAAKGKTGESPRFEKAVRTFDKYGIYAVAVTAPAFIGTQIAAMASVAAGVKPGRASVLIIASTLIWSAGIAIAMVAFDVRLDLS